MDYGPTQFFIDIASKSLNMLRLFVKLHEGNVKTSVSYGLLRLTKLSLGHSLSTTFISYGPLIRTCMTVRCAQRRSHLTVLHVVDSSVD